MELSAEDNDGLSQQACTRRLHKTNALYASSFRQKQVVTKISKQNNKDKYIAREIPQYQSQVEISGGNYCVKNKL